MFSDYINEKYLTKTKIRGLFSDFTKNKPFPHLILKDFFKEDFIRKVAKELLKEDFSFKESDLFRFSQTKDLISSNNKIIAECYNIINSQDFKDYLLGITGINSFEKIDCSGFIYGSGDHLLPHDDRLEKRKVAYVINLSEDFTKADGGSLEFFDNKNIVKSIVPSFNTFIIFQVIVNKTIHQVSEVLSDKKRLTIAGWFNDK